MPPRKREPLGDATAAAGRGVGHVGDRAEHVGDRAEPVGHRAEPLSAAIRPTLDASRLTHLVGYAASRAAIEMRKVFARHMKPFELKVVEFSILMLVAANPRVNQKQIGQTLDISAPNMAVTLDRMVERGWVQRVRSEQDRRAQHIHLTAQGRELVQRAGKVAATMEDSALRMLSAAERALLIELLLKVAAGKPAVPR